MSRTVFTVQIPLLAIAFLAGSWCQAISRCQRQPHATVQVAANFQPEITGLWEYDDHESMYQHYLINYLEEVEPRIGREEFFQKLDEDPSKRKKVSMCFGDDDSFKVSVPDQEFLTLNWRIKSREGRTTTVEFSVDEHERPSVLHLTFIDDDTFYTFLPGNETLEVFRRATGASSE